ncbi:chromatin accessibility complex protein 1 [Lepeophtheirus salmonis]|uniref:Chromatin accessibility complex protein 1 n=1 Tax=Lepeophtheirus salmonis TaxID=72036 RepID=C1BTE1_LEPSM|nr:chromatin accessibility complex protein 1-like [Lepeophtheirus salmonis]ACO12294.1 Chromatin accessibility complex protein 1 [Lepeophtheirus salmonis]ADD24367.1 Chromatin accessibility complex protein 1 [Lepeophtheirus salmonis]
MTTSNVTSPSSGSVRKDVSLPMSRVRTIMKSSPDIDNISQESLYLITKATEYFIIYLTKLSQKNGGNLGNVDYDDLSEVVERKNALEFLQDIIPKKIKYSEYLELMKKEVDVDEDDVL